MSLLKELQKITERTYELNSGINLEEFVIGKKRFWDLSELAGGYTKKLSDAARVFFRINSDNLFLGIYFSQSIIAELERCDPRRGLSEQNISPFIVFIEEINHGVHTALKFLSGNREIHREEFVRDLELLAKIDTYLTLKFFMAFFNASKQLESFDRLWLRHHLFERGDFRYDDRTLSERYFETNWLGDKYTRFLDTINRDHRLPELRRFRSMPYTTKAQYIRMLP